MSVCLWERVCVSVCERERERECVCLCVRESERKREKERECERDLAIAELRSEAPLFALKRLDTLRVRE